MLKPVRTHHPHLQHLMQKRFAAAFLLWQPEDGGRAPQERKETSRADFPQLSTLWYEKHSHLMQQLATRLCRQLWAGKD